MTEEPTFRDRRSAFREDVETPAEPDAAAAAEPAAPPEPPTAVEPPPSQPPPAQPIVQDPTSAEPEPEPEWQRSDPLGGEPPGFLEIVEMFAVQALQLLGEIPLNEAGERRVLPREAKHLIDLLGVLEDRTKGNLSLEEARVLQQVLGDLRLRYLKVGS